MAMAAARCGWVDADVFRCSGGQLFGPVAAFYCALLDGACLSPCLKACLSVFVLWFRRPPTGWTWCFERQMSSTLTSETG